MTRDGVVCCGLSCMDIFLVDTKPLITPEGCSIVNNVEMYPGGCTSNTGRMIKFLGVNVELLTLIGEDSHGDQLLNMWNSEKLGISFVRRLTAIPTAVSVLPVYSDGKRGLYFCPGTNKIMDIEHLFTPTPRVELEKYQVFHYGYPHLTPALQGQKLAQLFRKAQKSGCITSIDVNGADNNMSVISPCLPFVDVLHANVEEALLLHGKLNEVAARISNDDTSQFPVNIDDVVTVQEARTLAKSFLDHGVAWVTITLGMFLKR
jgi:sugar/nucleoside kinase (ribokinase family)